MRLLARWIVVTLCAVAFSAHGTSRADETAPPEMDRTLALPSPGATDLEAGIRKGVAFLVKTQNKNGSWGTPAPSLHVDVYAPVPGGYDAWQMGATGLALSSLVEVGGNEPGVEEAIRRGGDFVVSHHAVKRSSTDSCLNTWGHIYALEALARLHAREKDPARKAVFAKAAAEAVERLQHYEYVDGGWGYYDFDHRSLKPGDGTTTFTTSAGMVALKLASDQGIEVPNKLVRRARTLIRSCERPDGGFAYSLSTRYWPSFNNINGPKGSLARTSACLAALNAWEGLPKERIRDWLATFCKLGHFLHAARKYPIPHESWYQNAGYFCLFGYYYASQLMAALPPQDGAQSRSYVQSNLLPLQESDGSWWDYQQYGYHKPAGTGMALMALGRSRQKQ